MIDVTAAVRARAGSTVTYRDDDGEHIVILTDLASEFRSIGIVSTRSPLGKALQGATGGEIRSVEAPGGNWSLTVVRVE